MSGDTLTIVLFLVGTGFTFGMAALSQAGVKHPLVTWCLTALAVSFVVLGFTWNLTKDYFPATRAVIEQVASSPVAWFAVLIMGLTASFFLPRRPALTSNNTNAAKPEIVTIPPKIDIHFEKRAPYEVSKIQAGHVLSTVRIGIRNSGGGALSNCNVYIDGLSPATEYSGSFPLFLQGGFTVRHDDPEKLVDIAGRFDHIGHYRFSAPIPGGFFNADMPANVDAATPRTFVVKIEATECQRSVTFRIWSDDTKAIHLEFIGYVN